MKKIFYFVAALVMTAFVSCGQSTADNKGADSTVVDSVEITDSIVDSLAVADSVVADSTVCPD